MSEFFHMGGYAIYVWSSYAITLVVLALNVLVPLYKRRRLLAGLARRARRNESV